MKNMQLDIRPTTTSQVSFQSQFTHPSTLTTTMSAPQKKEPPVPRIGIGVFALRPDNSFIAGIRKGGFGAGTWALPGGHLEFGESLEECASRELREETGLEVEPGEMRFLTVTNTVWGEEQKHYVTVFMGCRVGEDATPEVCDAAGKWNFG
jgi:ADP-ribose pyrophosphatase YjhB (NUDIX family)